MPVKVEQARVDEWIKSIKEIHKIATDYDPETNIRDIGTLRYIVFEGLSKRVNEKMKTDVELGAFLMYNIATKHPFWDGNKRTALVLGLLFVPKDKKPKIWARILSLLDKDWGKREDSITKFMLELGEYKHTEKEVLQFLTGL